MNTAQLQEINEEEQAVDDVVVNKILSALKDGAKLRRQLARLTHLKVATIDLVIRSLEAQDKVKVVTIKNSCGRKPTVYISKVSLKRMHELEL
jgi:hypothetical protein